MSELVCLQALTKTLGRRVQPQEARIMNYCIDRAGEVIKVADMFKALRMDRAETYKRVDRLLKAGLLIDSSYPLTPMKKTKAIKFEWSVLVTLIMARKRTLDILYDRLREIKGVSLD